RLLLTQARADDAFSSTREDGRQEKIEHAKKWAHQSQAARKMQDALKLARSDAKIAVTAEQLDSHRHLLNMPNGTLNLDTMAVYPHRRGDLITKLTSGSYIPGSRNEDWGRTLGIFLPDVEVRSYLQRFIGTYLKGGNPEKKFGFAYGGTDTG